MRKIFNPANTREVKTGKALTRRALFQAGLVLSASLLLTACSGPALGPTKKMKLSGVNVEFNRPPENWTEQVDKGVAVIYRTPSGKGHIGITVIPKHPKLEEADVYQLGNAVKKRNGTITHQESTDMAGEKENAWRMEFAVGEGELAEKCAQIHFTTGGNLYSIVMTVPASEYSESKKVFDGVVRSFKVG